MIPQQRIDEVFDSRHAVCKGPRVGLQMCLPCAEFVIDVLGKVGNQLKALDAPSDLRYFVGSMEADFISQLVEQVDDADLMAAITS